MEQKNGKMSESKSWGNGRKDTGPTHPHISITQNKQQLCEGTTNFFQRTFKVDFE